MTRTETLEQRLQREFWEKNGNPDTLSSRGQFHPDIEGKLPQVINALITHTLEEAAEALEGMRKDRHDFGDNKGDGIKAQGYNQALTDAQNLLTTPNPDTPNQ